VTDPSVADAGTALAWRVAGYLWPQESLARRLGMHLSDVGVGRAVVELIVGEDMLNTQRFCHGGIIFTLADQAFAFAANSRNERSVTASCVIDYLQPVPCGERLRAIALEHARQGRAAYYDVRVERMDGEVVAIMRARAMSIGGTHVAP